MNGARDKKVNFISLRDNKIFIVPEAFFPTKTSKSHQNWLETQGNMPAKRPRSPAVSTSSESNDGGSSDSSSGSGIRPEKSKKQYAKAWDNFMEHIGYTDRMRRAPKEREYEGYFKHLLKEGKATSTLWTVYSMLSNGHMSRHGVTLKQAYPKLSTMLKNKSKTHKPKKAKSFSRQEIVRYMKTESPTVTEGQNKALVALAWYGGLRCAELRDISVDNITPMTSPSGSPLGFRVAYEGVKTDASSASRSFFVPETSEDGNVFASSLRAHLQALNDSGFTTGPVARHKHPQKNIFANRTVGRNYHYQLPLHIAKTLKLPTAGYSGHSLRRSAALAAADGGASTFQLRRHFGWRTEGTPQRYVDNSMAQNQVMANFMSGPQVNTQDSTATQACVLTSSQQSVLVPSQQSALTPSQRVTIDINLNIRQ